MLDVLRGEHRILRESARTALLLDLFASSRELRFGRWLLRRELALNRRDLDLLALAT
jgi:hypothetical protein